MADNWDRAIRMKARDAGLRLEGGRAVSNERMGVGGSSDIVLNAALSSGGYTQRNRPLLETLYAKFWAAAKIVDLKPDDAFAPGIVWSAEDEEQSETMLEEMKRLDVMRKALATVKAARVYGTALLVLAPKSGNFLEPLILDEIREGDISHLLVVDRFWLEDHIVEGNPANPLYGKVTIYRWNFRPPSGRILLPDSYISPYIDIHHSRCIRFDGVPPPTDDGWEVTGDDRWGQSILVRAVEDIIQDKLLLAGMAEVVKRASVPIIHLAGFKEMMGRGKKSKQGEMTAEDYANVIGDNLSSSKLMFLDIEDQVSKLELHTAGLLDIVKQQSERLAMIEGIPITRFTGESASGLSATGEGDARDWRITVENFRKYSVDHQMETLIDAVSKSAGLSDTPDWEWGRLGEASAEETALVAKSYAETVIGLVQGNIIDEEEARMLMNESELFDLDEDWTPPPLEVQMVPEPAQKTKGEPARPSRPTNMTTKRNQK